MSNKVNRDSPLVKSVLALDGYLSELERVGTKINSTDMTSEFDLDFVQKLMNRFAECGQGVSEEVTKLSTQLQEAQTRAETVAQGVSKQAQLFKLRRTQQNEKMEEFRLLGEKVRDLNGAISNLRPVVGEGPSKLTSRIPALEAQLSSLIVDLQNLRQSARGLHMRPLEKNAESLVQRLGVVRKKLQDLNR
jgi:chromosome segregation ATPase